jgi:hypothetical protein
MTLQKVYNHKKLVSNNQYSERTLWQKSEFTAISCIAVAEK